MSYGNKNNRCPETWERTLYNASVTIWGKNKEDVAQLCRKVKSKTWDIWDIVSYNKVYVEIGKFTEK